MQFLLFIQASYVLGNGYLIIPVSDNSYHMTYVNSDITTVLPYKIKNNLHAISCLCQHCAIYPVNVQVPSKAHNFRVVYVLDFCNYTAHKAQQLILQSNLCLSPKITFWIDCQMTGKS